MAADRIKTMHAGSLPRPADVWEMVNSKARGEAYDEQALARRLREAVAEVVQQQLACDLDSINDGELSKTSFTAYARDRIAGFEERRFAPGEEPAPQAISGRDKAALGGVDAEPFLPAVAPGTIEHWLRNDYYPTDEAYVYGIADAMHEEYKAIVDAGFLLQIDDPDLADAWQIHTEMSVRDYRKFAELRIDALNHALRDIPEEAIRFHMCWGSYHGPHKYDIPLADIVDLILKVKAQSYSIEASNPVHDHEWRVWEDVKLPDGKLLIPGVGGHATDFIEHPELVAERLMRYANLVSKENVMAGTDCGIGTRVGHPSICWAKFESLSEGARLASQRLWT